MKMKDLIVLTSMVAASGGHRLAAQNLGMEYTTEIQTDFRKGSNWVNLLRLDFSVEAQKDRIEFDAATISIAKTREKRLADDYQVYSNIEEESFPVALSVLGMTWKAGRSTVFLGIRNLNEDYFATPVTSLFTNSSCGIFPTLSANFPIANYPLSSLGIDYKFQSGGWTVETSLYNGRGYRRFTGRDNVFRFCPKSDGLLNMTMLGYMSDGNVYCAGTTLHHGAQSMSDDDNTLPDSKAHETNFAIWAYAEQKLSHNVHVMGQCSAKTTGKQGCRQYAGLGMTVKCGRTEGGLFADYADFTTAHEWAAELTWKIPCFKDHGYVQPALHVISNSRENNVIGLLRMGYRL